MTRTFGAVAARQLRTSRGKADSRAQLIRAVRAAAARLRMTDDDRHALQQELVGKGSLTDMTLAEIGQVLDRLNRDRPAPMAHRAHIGKIKALWWTLYWLSEVGEPGEAALDAFVKRQTGIARLRFVDFGKAPAVIEALKAMAARAGVQWPGPAAVAAIGAAIGGSIDQAHADRAAVLVALWDRLLDAGIAQGGGYERYVAAALKLAPGGVWTWSSHELDAAIRLLGKRLRRAMDKRVDP